MAASAGMLFYYVDTQNQSAPKDEVDPGVQALADVVALECLAVQAHKLVRAAVRPGRQLHIAQLAPILPQHGHFWRVQRLDEDIHW